MTVVSTPSQSSSLSSPSAKLPLVGVSSSATLLSDTDKARIKAMYDSLNVDKKVEIQMNQLAMKSNYEHPCHSLIMDVDDTTWDEYFTKEELIEISQHNKTTIPAIPAELCKYLEAIGHVSTAKDFGRLANEYYDHPSCEWALAAISIAVRFYEKSATGIDLLLRPWHILSSAFEYSIVGACPGELASQVNKASRNQKRTMDSISHKDRSKCGSKVDIRYRGGAKELGCVEAGKEQGMNGSTKEMKDGWLKQPKIMKDILYALATRHLN